MYIEVFVFVFSISIHHINTNIYETIDSITHLQIIIQAVK